jgi:hypothetical protein
VWTNARADPVLWIRSGPRTGYATIGHIPYQESFVAEYGKHAWIELQPGGCVNAGAHSCRGRRRERKRFHPRQGTTRAVARAASCIDSSWTSSGSPLWIRQGEGTGYALATNGYHRHGAGFPNGSRFHGQCTGTGWLFVTNNGDYPTGYVNPAYAPLIRRGY